MHEHLPARIPHRIEVEPALDPEVELGPDVGDEEQVVEGVAVEVEAEPVPHGAAEAVGREEVAATELDGAAWRARP